MDSELRASWNRLCGTLKESADYIFDPALGADASEQAEGLRHQLEYAAAVLTLRTSTGSKA